MTNFLDLTILQKFKRWDRIDFRW